MSGRGQQAIDHHHDDILGAPATSVHGPEMALVVASRSGRQPAPGEPLHDNLMRSRSTEASFK